MDAQSTLYSIYVVAMVAGAITFALMSRDPRGVPMYEYLIAILIPVWSGAAYLSLAFDQSTVSAFGREVPYARYLDWVVSTPLLLLALALTAMFFIPKDKTLIAALIGADVVMVLSGLIADLSPDRFRYVWYLIGVVAFVVVLGLIWGPLRAKAESQGPELAAVFQRVAGLLTVLWFGYPIFWLLGPSGIGVWDRTADTFLFVALPIVSKVVWSFVDLTALRALDKSPRGARSVATA